MFLDKEVALTFDDVLVVPQHSTIESRSQVDTSTSILGLDLKIPIISANMNTVTEVAMATEMWRLGGLGILHRYATPELTVDWLKRLIHNAVPSIPSVGVHESNETLAKYLDTGTRYVCLDVAHADNIIALRMIEKLTSNGFKVMAGNISTPEAAKRLAGAGAKAIKLGQGSGSFCTTRVVTGHGVSQLTAVIEVSEALKDLDVDIIADGGIRNSGDIVKCLAAGADAVMIGGLLSGTEETPGDLYDQGGNPIGGAFSNGPVFKKYQGMASRDAQVGWRGNVHNDAPEGESSLVPSKGPVANIIKELVGGIRSGLSYSGCKNIKEFQESAILRVVTPATVRENGPHGKR